jgi:hypothetical protein
MESMFRPTIVALASALALTFATLAPLCGAAIDPGACCGSCDPAGERQPVKASSCCSAGERTTVGLRTPPLPVVRPSQALADFLAAIPHTLGAAEARDFKGARLETPGPPLYVLTHDYRI